MAILRILAVVITLAIFAVLVVPACWVLRPGSRAADGFARLFCRTILFLMQVRVFTTGPVGPLPTPRLVVANHVSWIDVLALGSVEPLCFLAKREVGAWPVVSAFAVIQRTVFVDRTRRKAIPPANAAMADRMAAGRSVALFAEGTTHDGSRRGRFLTSHLACLRDRMVREPDLAGCLAQAVALTYSDPVAAWVGDASLVPHVWTIARHPGLVCGLAYGSPIEVERGYDRKALGRRLANDVEILCAALAPVRVGIETAVDPRLYAQPMTRGAASSHRASTRAPGLNESA